MRIRLLTIAVIVAAALWGGYWFVGAGALKTATAAAFAAARAEGHVANYADLEVEGFPNRFDLTLDKIRLGDRTGGVLWQAPFAQVLALSYTPYHVILALPHDQRLRLAGQTLRIASKRFEGSVIFHPTPALRLKSATFVIDQPAVTSDAGWRLGQRQLRLAARAAQGANAYRVGLEALDIAPGPGLRAWLDPAGTLPATAKDVHLDADLSFSAPLDRHAGRTQPRLTAVHLRDARAEWGDMAVTAKGALSVDAAGRPAGRIAVTAHHWRRIVDLLAAAGLVDADQATGLRRMLAGVAQGTDDPTRVTIPLTFRDGMINVGFLPLGPAPLLR